MKEDHPCRTIAVGCLPLLVSPTIRNLKVTKMLVDGGAGLNLISPAVISKLQIGEEELEVTGMFQGINPGRSRPKGKIMLLVMFGGELNYRTKKIVFDVVELPLPYNGILRRPALAKFMAASHYAYNTLKMPGHSESSPSRRMRRMQLFVWTRCTGTRSRQRQRRLPQGK